jgi:tetrahydromethanopterin S-methyltransferase subunit G
MPNETMSEAAKLPRFSVSDVLKVLGALFLFLMAWARVEAAINSMNMRLDRIEASENVYVRGDVAQARADVVAAELADMKLRLERIEMKVDYLGK